MQLSGSIVALVTPMHSDGSLDFAALDRLIDWHIEQGTAAIAAVGTTGESATLDVREHCDVISATVRRVAGRIPVIAGTGANSTTEAIELTESAARSGADACLLVTPYYNKPSQEGLYQHHRMVAERVAIPQILYNVPGRTAVDMQVETVARLAEIDNIVAIKDATGDLERGRELIDRCSASLAVYSGDDATAVELMLMGAVGNVSVTANVAPAQMAAVCRSAIQQSPADAAQTRELNAPLESLHRDLFVEANPIPVKWALARMGMIESGIRLPLTALDVRYHERVESALSRAGIL